MGHPPAPTAHDPASRSDIPDPYRPLPPSAASGAPPAPEEEPNSTGTLFLMMIFLMMIVALWAIVYLMLLHR